MPHKVSSLTNPKIKNVVRLRERRHREKSGLTIVEGNREIERVLEAGVGMKELYICPEFLAKHFKGDFLRRVSSGDVEVTEVTKEVFAKISYGDRHEGALAVCEFWQHPLYDVTLSVRPLLVIVEAVEKPGNLGAILRTCDGVGVDGVIVCDPKTDIYNPNVIRASLGSIFSLKVVASTNDETMHFLKEKNIKIYATMPDAKKDYTDVNLRDAAAIVVGSEAKGLSDFWSQHADYHVRIPMRGKADSLNVSASTAILLYEAVRQRG